MTDSKQYKIFQELADLKSNYEGTSLEKIQGLYRSQYKVIKMCEYYSDSRYMGANYGNKDELGRDVPFYNIVNYRVALAKTATDLDIKDIQIISDNPNYQVHSMLLNRECYEWMKEAEFSKTLNEMGITRPKYGGYLLKKTEDDENELNIEVVRWTNVITDQNDILKGVIIEKHPMSPITLNSKSEIWENVIDVLKAFKKIKAKDKPPTIDVYEITGEFPISKFKDASNEEVTEEDEYKYSLQHYFVAELDGKKFLLFKEEYNDEMTDHYEYLSWEDNGFGLGRGVIEDSEEAQVWTNDAVIQENTAMSLAGRVGVKTTSKKFGNSILEHDHGKVYNIEKDEDFASVSFVPAALGQYQNLIEKWKAQADNITSSFNAATGEQPPSGTPYSQTALLNQVATRPFDYKREEWGIHLSRIFNNWVVPYLIKKIKKEHVLVSEFTDAELEVIDESFSNYYANDTLFEEVMKNKIVTPEMQAGVTEGYKKHIKKFGKKRFLEVPEDYFTDIECKTTVITTGEQKNKAVILDHLTNILDTVVKSFNPNTGTFGVLTDPTLAMIFKQLLEIGNSGISPVSLGKIDLNVKPVSQTPQTALPSPVEMTQPTQ